jgi:hypothetical protein
MVGTTLAALPFLAEMRLARAAQPLTDRWKTLPVAPRGNTLLGISFRPRQVEALGLEITDTLNTLLAYPFQLVRLGAYWDRCEPTAGRWNTSELDVQIEAAQRAGKKILLAVGAVKTFGYPEFFVPAHYRAGAFREGHLVTPTAQPRLLEAATRFVTQIVERYRDLPSIIGWQVEHEAADPLGMEHTWRLAEAFIAAEVQAVRTADSSRPIILNGFLTNSLVVRLSQGWQTRDQGDSLAVAQRLADIVGIDDYPRHALLSAGNLTLYLDGSQTPWQVYARTQAISQITRLNRRWMVTEGQAEPWETVTNPPNPNQMGMYSCLPEHLVENYNRWLAWNAAVAPYAYLFWGAEYWLRRQKDGDGRYLNAFARILESSQTNDNPQPQR